MSLITQLSTALTQIGADIKALKASDGDLTSMGTTATTLAGAIAELKSAIGSAGAQIDDTKGDGDTAVTWSADKIHDTIEAAKQAVKNDLLDGAPTALDTLNELAQALNDDAAFSTTIVSSLNNKVDFAAAQTLTAAQKLQACENIGIGDPETNLTTIYTTARDS